MSSSREPLIGLMADAGPHLAVGLLGILKSGGAFVPLHPAQPEERLRFAVRDCGIEVVVTESHYLPLALRVGREAGCLRSVVCLDEPVEIPPAPPGVEVRTLAGFVPRGPETWNGPGRPPTSLAYVIYTSGSTGTPKGVGVSHANVVPMLLWSRDYFGLDKATRVLQSLSYAFDFGAWEILTTLISGGVLHVLGSEEFGDPAAYGRRALAAGIDTVHTTPSFFRAVAEADVCLEGLRILHLGGEALVRSQVEQLAEAVGAGCVIYNGYGPTEVTVNSLIFAVGRPGDLRGGERVPIGRPSADNTVYVVDRRAEPLPVGVPGELWVGGPGVARGYLGRPDLTAEKFVPDRFGDELGGRLYRTGDLVRWLPDGELEFLGRLDHQVKVRGFRIELGEIESALLAQPGVREAVVVVREDAPGDRRLVAYVVGEAGAPELRRSLGERLPEYMVPSAFVFLEALPLTPNGKLDRRALPASEESAETGYVAPRTLMEELLAGIWSGVLGLERVGVEDHFFERGGHSLLAVQVVARVREVLGVEVPVRRLFEAPTLGGLAARIEAERGSGAVSGQPPLVRRSWGVEVPVSFAQERLWFLDQLEPGSAAYHIPGALRLEGDLDVTALEAALWEIVRRHEALRTALRAESGRPAGVLVEAAPELMRIDLSSLASPEPEARRLVREETLRPFDLSRGPLVRFGLLRLSEREHVLVLVLHHIAADGWSLGIWSRELAALYEAFAAGKPSPLPELAVQYADYAAWQRQWLQGEVLGEQLSYWTEQLSGLESGLDLPSDRARPAVASLRGASESVSLPGPLVRSLERLSRQRGSTLYMTLLGCFEALLLRWSGQERFAVGAPVAGRTRVETEGLIGLFVNTLVLRAEAGGDPRFGELLERVRETALGAYGHQELPFEKLVEALSPERALSRTPLFQVMFVLQNAPLAEARVSGLRLGGVELASERAKFDLTLALSPRGEGGLAGALEYNRDLFDRATIARLLSHWSGLVESVAVDADWRLSDLPLLSPAERHQLLVEWNASSALPAGPRGLHELFAAQAARTPEASALWFAGESLSYGGLDARANRLANRLRRLGVGPETRVGVCLERTPELVVALLAVLKAGGAYVPLDPRYPEARLELMLADSDAKVLVCQESVLESLPDFSGERMVLEREDLSGESVEAPRSGGSAANLAYLIYTSGSTGRPKGVAIEHASAWALVEWASGVFGPEDLSGVLVSTSVCFDLSVFEIFVPLALGGRLVLAANALELPCLSGAGVTLVNTVPSAMTELVRLGGVPSSVRVVNLAGEPLKRSLVESLYKLGVGRVLNLYGPSEDTTYSTGVRIAPGEGRAPAIGRPVLGSLAYVVDRDLRPAPLGAVGELLLGGAGLARGYLGRPELTAERFVPDPWGRGGRLYRTGDRVRYRPDGELEFLGRLDHQVKVRGFRIEPGEIESALLSLSDVCDAAVVVREDEPGDRRLVAYVVGEATAPELRRSLAERLPEHMVPQAFVSLASLPLTPNGKVDRKALPRPEGEREGEYVAPRTPVEELLAGIWSSVLGTERVGARDHFFALGGHSLLAVQVVSRVREVLGVELPVRRLFETPTLEALAAWVEAERALGTPAAPPLVRWVREGAVPLSFAQERLWFLDQLEPGSAAYNIPGALRLEGDLDVPALERALAEIVDRHEALRTVFRAEGGRPAGVVLEERPALAFFDLSGSPDEAPRLAREEALRPFDLLHGPLARFSLLRLGDREHVLLVNLHHIAADGWSLGVLVRELVALYEAFSRREPSPLPELPVQYADYAAWQREWLEGPVLDEQLAYWTGQLAGLEPGLDLPTDRPRPALPSYEGESVPLRLPAALVVGLEALSRQRGATLFMTLLAAFESLLSRWAGPEDLAVGTPVAGRTRVETEGLIGLFVNPLVLRGDLQGNPAFAELLERVRETALGAFGHQDLPFEKLVEALSPDRALSRAPLFQVMLVLQNAPMPELSASGLRLSGLALESGTAKFDLTLSLASEGQDLAGSLEFSRELFDRSTVARLAGGFVRLVEGALAAPERRLAELPLLSAGERHQLLVEWNAALSPGEPRCLHELFEARAAERPEAEAIRFGDFRISYGELDRRANRLAHRLRRSGVGPEVRVGVCLERTPSLLLALLAVLKAGGAYVPLDPRYPEARLELMLVDSGARLLISEEAVDGQVPAFPGERVLLDREGEDLESESGQAPASGVRAGNLAYLIYTSGSTGRPKGVAIEHASAAALVAWAGSAFAAENLSGMLASTSVCFDLSVFEIFVPWSWGGRVILAADALELPHLPAAGEVRVVNTVPSAMTELVRMGGLPASVRTVNLAGEPLQRSLVDGLYAAEVERVFNLYGPSEDTTYSTFARIGREDSRTPSIGRPVWGTRAYVVAPGLAPAGLGSTGELLLGGSGLARGYLGRPELTAERFIPDPFGPPGGRLYRTGDRVRYRPDGDLEFLGRLDHQVKVRGFRIELGEIEAALLGQPGVRDAVVVAREDVPGDRRLVGYVAGAAKAADLRRALSERLPEHMVPSAFVLLETLPLTPNGKVDRRALPRPEGVERQAEYAAPRTPVEQGLAAIWSEVLRVERIGLHDNFFTLGGHSLLATQVLARVRETFDVAEIPLRSLFQNPTLGELALAVTQARAGQEDEDEMRRMIEELQGLSADDLAELLEESEPS